jgi:hypothetical protein
VIDPKKIEVVDDAIAAILRGMAPAQRVELVFQAETLTRTLMAAGVKSRHPDWSDQEIQQEVARIWLLGPA